VFTVRVLVGQSTAGLCLVSQGLPNISPYFWSGVTERSAEPSQAPNCTRAPATS